MWRIIFVLLLTSVFFSCKKKKEGCTDPAASNFDPEATIKKNCVYPPPKDGSVMIWSAAHDSNTWCSTDPNSPAYFIEDLSVYFYRIEDSAAFAQSFQPSAYYEHAISAENSQPDCSASGSHFFYTGKPGVYGYKAYAPDYGVKEWSGRVSISSSGCTVFRLEKQP